MFKSVKNGDKKNENNFVCNQVLCPGAKDADEKDTQVFTRG